MWLGKDSLLKQIHIHSFDIFNSDIETSKYIKFLGVLLDQTLSMLPHISVLSRTCFFPNKAAMAGSTLPYSIDIRTISICICSIETIEFCNSILSGIPISSSGRLQAVLHAAARLLTFTRRYEHMGPVLKTLHWLPYPQRISF